ncbi:MAG TPA: cyclic nucleotide-binding domain-containing protein [Vicinamibacteria bacterium]
MVLGRSGKGEDVGALIAKKNYTRAIEVIRQQLQTQRNDPRLRLQLADVLVSAGKNKEAVTILLPLADEFAKDGFAAKAISILKKVQRIDPGRRDIDSRLATLIQDKQRLATVVGVPPSGGALELGMEEIGFEPPPSASEPVAAPRVVAPEPPAPVAPPPAPVRAPPPPPARVAPAPPPAAAEPELELEAAPELDFSGSLSPVVETTPPPVPVEPVVEFDLGVDATPVVEEAPLDLGLEPEALPLVEVEPVPAPTAAPDPRPELAEPVVDQDLFTGEFESVETVLEVEPTAAEEPVSDPMSDSKFADELFSVLENAFPGPGEPVADSTDATPSGGAQIVVSPLFKDFSVEELVAVIAGLKLLTFERGKVILREGEPGNSLYMLTSGAVKAFVKRDGKQVPIAELEEGAFFGEGSILTGKPRTATIVATEHSELLELDRPTLDSITQTHPHVWDVLQEFANQRMAKKG